MESKSTILFTYLEFLLIGEVKRQTLDEVPIYDIQFALTANPQSVEGIEIYRGSGPGNRIYWRQRVVSANTCFVNQELVEIIGEAIKELENS